MVLQDGQRLQNGKYIIVGEPLGKGGFGITYKALHVPLNEEVVIKTPDKYLKTHPEYSKYIERFIQEGQKLARLSKKAHPNIVRVRDLFQEGEIHCLVMDFVPGENLFQVVTRRGRLSEADAVSCFQQIGDALATMHEAGLVHRDAHPGNIILRDDGRVILIDFGIAKELVPTTMSSTGVAGNAGFAPYEQLVRGSREPNVDVYCLAATLYYAVTGQCPTPSLDRKLSNTALIPPQQLVPSISQDLKKAILKGMKLEAKDRPQLMRQWLAMLAVPKKLPKIIPWGWLAGMLLLYAVQGWVATVAGAGAVVVAWAGAWAGAVAWAGAWAWAVAWAGAVAWVLLAAWCATFAVALALPMAWAVAWVDAMASAGAALWAVAGAVALAGALAGALAWAWADVVFGTSGVAGKELLKSFNRFHTFLILASTSTLGLGLGWLIYKILRWLEVPGGT